MSSKIFIIGVISFISLFAVFNSPLHSSRSTPLFTAGSSMGIVHIVMFEFKEEAGVGEIKDVSVSFISSIVYE